MAAACEAMLEVVRPAARLVRVDAYSAYRDQLPSDAEAAQHQLRAIGSRRRRGDPGMGIALHPGDERDWNLLVTYAGWSIHVEAFRDEDGREGLATLHDCGSGIDAWLTDSEAHALAARLNGVAPVELKVELQRRYADAERPQRTARMEALRRRLRRLARANRLDPFRRTSITRVRKPHARFQRGMGAGPAWRAARP